jgi:hypothetical protein
VIDTTIEQKFKLRQIEDALNHPETKKEDIITVFMALQQQTFILGNNITNLLKAWPTVTSPVPPTTDEDPYKFGTLFETKD